jgi:hypothetical protein
MTTALNPVIREDDDGVCIAFERWTAQGERTSSHAITSLDRADLVALAFAIEAFLIGGGG